MKHKSKVLIIICIIIFSSFYFPGLLKTKDKPNIIIVTFDALRPDHLGCYGYSRNTSPNVDQLAREGVLFLNVISQASFTSASLSSILTSSYPEEHGVLDFNCEIAKDFVPVFNKIKKSGYRSAFFSNHIGISSINGFNSYFDNFCVIRTNKQDVETKEIIETSKLNEKIINWIDDNKNKHFLLWVHYLSPHFPMFSPLKYRRMFLDESNPEAVNNTAVSKSPNDYIGFKGLPRRLVKLNNNVTDLNYYINLYDASIRHTDSQIGELLDSLKRLNLYKNTIIVVSSDHGEGLGEHGLYFTHKIQLYDELIKVPLIIKLPQPFIKVKRVITQVRHIDIMPTIFEIIGIKKAPSMFGQSILSLIKVGETYCNDKYAPSFSIDKVSLRSNEWKIIYNKSEENYELYNLKSDPGERNNVIYSEKEEFKALKYKLIAYLPKKITHSKSNKDILDEDSKKELMSLGYAQ